MHARVPHPAVATRLKWFQLVRNPTRRWPSDFAKLCTGQTISQIGTQVSGIALPLTAIVVRNPNAAEVGTLRAAQTVPWLLLGLLAGVLVDRMPLRRLLVGCELARAGLLLTIPLASISRILTVWQLYVIALAVGTLTVIF